MANKKETAVPNVSVGADTEQPPNVNNKYNQLPAEKQ